jgi:hypothetical protein
LNIGNVPFGPRLHRNMFDERNCGSGIGVVLTKPREERIQQNADDSSARRFAQKDMRLNRQSEKNTDEWRGL